MSSQQDIEQTARHLAEAHAQEDKEVIQIYWARSTDEVQLIEVTQSLTDVGEVLPFRFAPDPPDVMHPSVVILLSPGDWERCQAGGLHLPDSFGSVTDLKRIFPKEISYGN